MISRTSIPQQVSKKGKRAKGCKVPKYGQKDHYKPQQRARPR